MIDPISTIGPKALTQRQLEVARLIAGGLTNAEIAEELELSLDGAKFHVSRLLTQLGLRRREEVGEWYRAHFGPVARLRTRVRRVFSGISVTWLAAGTATSGALLVAVVFLGGWGLATSPDADEGGYMPFVQEWEITQAGEPAEFATLTWTSCEEWTYEVRDDSGAVRGTSVSDGPRDDGVCHIPGYWFRPVGAYRGPSSAGFVAVAPDAYEHISRFPCSAADGWNTGLDLLPDGFCVEVDGTYEDRVRAEFDSATGIPTRYVQYVDGVVTEERRAVSLVLR